MGNQPSGAGRVLESMSKFGLELSIYRCKAGPTCKVTQQNKLGVFATWKEGESHSNMKWAHMEASKQMK